MPFSCKNCKKNFKISKSYKYHIEKKVCIDKSFFCLKCNNTYKRRDTLMKHIRAKHNCEKTSMLVGEHKKYKIECPFCDKFFLNKANLKRHISENCIKTKEVLEKSITLNDFERNKHGGTTIINNGNINNTINNNNITNNINIININQFEKEDVNKISFDDFLEAIKNPRDIPVKYLELKHIRTLCNMNICIKNKDMIFVFKGDHWQELKSSDVCHLMKNGAIYDIDQFIRTNEIMNSDEINERLDEIEGERKYDDIMDLLMNNSGALLTNFNKNKAQMISYSTFIENKKKKKKN